MNKLRTEGLLRLPGGRGSADALRMQPTLPLQVRWGIRKRKQRAWWTVTMWNVC